MEMTKTIKTLYKNNNTILLSKRNGKNINIWQKNVY